MIDEVVPQRAVDFHGHMCPGPAMGCKVGMGRSSRATGEVGPSFYALKDRVVEADPYDLYAVEELQVPALP